MKREEDQACEGCAFRDEDCGHVPQRSDGGWECYFHQRAAAGVNRLLAESCVADEGEDDAPVEDTPASIIEELVDAVKVLRYIGDRIDRAAIKDLIARAEAVLEKGGAA